MAFSNARCSPHPYSLRIYKFKFTVFTFRHRIVFRDGHFICRNETKTPGGSAGLAAVDWPVEGSRETRAVDHKGYCCSRRWYAMMNVGFVPGTYIYTWHSILVFLYSTAGGWSIYRFRHLHVLILPSFSSWLIDILEFTGVDRESHGALRSIRKISRYMRSKLHITHVICEANIHHCTELPVCDT